MSANDIFALTVAAIGTLFALSLLVYAIFRWWWAARGMEKRQDGTKRCKDCVYCGRNLIDSTLRQKPYALLVYLEVDSRCFKNAIYLPNLVSSGGTWYKSQECSAVRSKPSWLGNCGPEGKWYIKANELRRVAVLAEKGAE